MAKVAAVGIHCRKAASRIQAVNPVGKIQISPFEADKLAHGSRGAVAVVRTEHRTEELYRPGYGPQSCFSWMQAQSQRGQQPVDPRQRVEQAVAVAVHDVEVIDIAPVVPEAERPCNEVVQLVEKHV